MNEEGKVVVFVEELDRDSLSASGLIGCHTAGFLLQAAGVAMAKGAIDAVFI
ncbi:MAG: hypothetical protein H0V24_00740 [Chloroflexia bacterium]|nr:hypothetical protein [Chloroflexia bacterium]